MILTAVFLFAGQNEVQAAQEISLTEPCSVTFEIPTAYRDRLEEQDIELRLFRIADITKEGEYQDRKNSQALKIADLSVDSSARLYKQKAEEAADYLGVEEWEKVPQTTPDAEFKIIENRGMQTDMEPGVYLVCMKPVYFEDEVYQAEPYIITLPGFMENIEKTNGEKYYWIKDAVVDLKLARKALPQKQEPQEPEKPEKTVQPLDADEIKTGDESRWEEMLLLLLGALCILIGLGIAGKKKQGERRNHERKATEGTDDSF